MAAPRRYTEDNKEITTGHAIGSTQHEPRESNEERVGRLKETWGQSTTAIENVLGEVGAKKSALGLDDDQRFSGSLDEAEDLMSRSVIASASAAAQVVTERQPDVAKALQARHDQVREQVLSGQIATAPSPDLEVVYGTEDEDLNAWLEDEPEDEYTDNEWSDLDAA